MLTKIRNIFLKGKEYRKSIKFVVKTLKNDCFFFYARSNPNDL